MPPVSPGITQRANPPASPADIRKALAGPAIGQWDFTRATMAAMPRIVTISPVASMTYSMGCITSVFSSSARGATTLAVSGRARANVSGMVLIGSMESVRKATADNVVQHADALHDFSAIQDDVDREFDALVDSWVQEHGEYDETRDCLDALVETRAVISAMHAREQRLLARLEAIALTSSEQDAHGESRELAWRSMAAEIAVATRQADRTVQSMMGRATAFVSKLPVTIDALEHDRISIAHAHVILENAMGLPDDALPEYERVTVGRAEETTPGKLAATARLVAARLNTETFEERHAHASEARSVSLRDLDSGMSELIHTLPTAFAAAIFDRLTRQAKAVAATGDPRTRDQLRSDLATDLLLTGEPAAGEGAPHTAADSIRANVSITIPALTLLGSDSEPATMSGRGPIDLDTALGLTTAAPEFTRVLVHPVTGMVIAADTSRPSASLRRYLEARDRHCRFPMCHRDARWCDVDHTVAWEHGGKTVPENLAHLCRGHHSLKHHAGWTVKQTSPGILEWRTPRGDIVAGAAPPGPTFQHQDSPPPF